MAILNGTPGTDILLGTPENDLINGFGGDDILDGAGGNDTLYGGDGGDFLSGGDGDDALYGGNGDDFLSGGNGNDILDGGNGNDTLDGGNGLDIASYREANGPVVVSLAAGTATGAAGSDVLISIEGIEGSRFNDLLIGDAGLNFFLASPGNDTIDGGAGIDVVSYHLATGGVTVNLASGTAIGIDGNDTLINIEWVEGSPFNDALTGDANHNRFDGGLGNDVIDGGGGADTVAFGSTRGSNELVRTAFGFTVSGPEGLDTLVSIERLQFSDVSLAYDLGAGEAAGNTARLLGAVFGREAVHNKEYAGIGLALFDGGMSYAEVAHLAVGVVLGPNPANADLVRLLYTNVVGVAPDAATTDSFVALITSGQLTQVTLTLLAADHQLNANAIGLVGLQQSGLEFL